MTPRLEAFLDHLKMYSVEEVNDFCKGVKDILAEKLEEVRAQERENEENDRTERFRFIKEDLDFKKFCELFAYYQKEEMKKTSELDEVQQKIDISVRLKAKVKVTGELDYIKSEILDFKPMRRHNQYVEVEAGEIVVTASSMTWDKDKDNLPRIVHELVEGGFNHLSSEDMSKLFLQTQVLNDTVIREIQWMKDKAQQWQLDELDEDDLDDLLTQDKENCNGK